MTPEAHYRISELIVDHMRDKVSEYQMLEEAMRYAYRDAIKVVEDNPTLSGTVLAKKLVAKC